MFERRRDLDAAREVVVNELVWLLAEDPSRLEADQNTIRTMFAERLSWDSARPAKQAEQSLQMKLP
jgi:hypothetical protein